MFTFFIFFVATMTMMTQDYSNCIDYGLNGKAHVSCTQEQKDKMASNLAEVERKQGFKTLYLKD